MAGIDPQQAVTRHTGATFLERRSDVDARGLDGGGEPEEHAAEDGEGGGKREDSPIQIGVDADPLEFGEGERINLRGTIPTLTKTTLNGHALATADWFILDQLNTTRSFNYLMLPADLIGKVKVLKSAEADVEEGGIGGTVDVETRKPLDLDPFTAYVSGQGAYTEKSAKLDPQATALISWKD